MRPPTGCNKQPPQAWTVPRRQSSALNTKEGRRTPGRAGFMGFVGMSSSAGDTNRHGDSPMGHVGESRKGKDRSPIPAEAEASLVRKHASNQHPLCGEGRRGRVDACLGWRCGGSETNRGWKQDEAQGRSSSDAVVGDFAPLKYKAMGTIDNDSSECTKR